MAIHLNPMAQAEMELEECVHRREMQTDIVMQIIRRAVEGERLMMGQHTDCGAVNPDGKAAGCQCYCHKGHYRHEWHLVNKTPAVNPDGVTYHLLYECKYCPDLRFKVIKTGFIKEKHTLINLEYLIRGEQRVLSKEEWLERRPEGQSGEFIKKGGL